MYPEDCIQSIIAKEGWWLDYQENQLCRGALISTFIPHITRTPFTFEPISRSKPEEHGRAVVKAGPLKVDQPLKKTDLPVAAMTLTDDEVWTAYRAKKRPCIVIGIESPAVDKSLTAGKPKLATAPTVLVAPYYGIPKNDKRAGYDPRFIELVRHCEFPQFVWDLLPAKKGTGDSLLRLDQMQPIGAHHDSYKLLNHRLNDDGLAFIDDMLSWLITGSYKKDGNLEAYRDLMKNQFSSASN